MTEARTARYYGSVVLATGSLLHCALRALLLRCAFTCASLCAHSPKPHCIDGSCTLIPLTQYHRLCRSGMRRGTVLQQLMRVGRVDR